MLLREPQHAPGGLNAHPHLQRVRSWLNDVNDPNLSLTLTLTLAKGLAIALTLTLTATLSLALTLTLTLTRTCSGYLLPPAASIPHAAGSRFSWLQG